MQKKYGEHVREINRSISTIVRIRVIYFYLQKKMQDIIVTEMSRIYLRN